MMRIVALIAVLMTLAACHHPKQEDKTVAGTNTADSIRIAANLQADSIKAVREANESTRKSVETVRTDVDASNKNASTITATTQDPVVRSNVDQIVQHNQKIRETADTISKNSETIKTNIDAADKHNQQINKDAVAVIGLQKKIVELENEKQKMQNDAIKNLYTTLSFFFGLGFVTIVAGLVLAFLVNRKLGYSIAGLGLMGLALAAGAIFYLKTIAVVSIVIIIAAIVVCVGLGVWQFVAENREKKVLEQANVENVQLVQTIKDRLDPAAKVEIFGEVKKGIAHELQSEKTQQIVQQAKKKIKNKSPST